MQVALVVGASGGVGQEIVRELLSAGSPAVTVRAFVRDPAKAAALWSGADAGGGRLQLVKGDVTQPETIAAAVKGADVVILTHSRRLGEAGATAEAVDYGGTCAVCKAAAAERVSRMVYVSSNSLSTGLGQPAGQDDRLRAKLDGRDGLGVEAPSGGGGPQQRSAVRHRAACGAQGRRRVSSPAPAADDHAARVWTRHRQPGCGRAARRASAR
jgi:NAD(P)-dependent dehydrogenase (short-subunit alcohol dehydrogenase family)